MFFCIIAAILCNGFTTCIASSFFNCCECYAFVMDSQVVFFHCKCTKTQTMHLIKLLFSVFSIHPRQQ